MTFKNLQTIVDQAIELFSEQMALTELPTDDYTLMRYPKLMPFMTFNVKRYAVEGYGHLFAMYTKALGGVMQLATLVWTPSFGSDVPLLLVDVMAMGKKRLVFVEYYDLTTGSTTYPHLDKVAQRYSDIVDYPEKEAWYVKERTPYSLIKEGTDEATLLAMLRDSVQAYGVVCKKHTQVHTENVASLSAFVERMVQEGNPSAGTMKRVLGKEKADTFFREAVMPIYLSKEEISMRKRGN